MMFFSIKYTTQVNDLHPDFKELARIIHVFCNYMEIAEGLSAAENCCGCAADLY